MPLGASMFETQDLLVVLIGFVLPVTIIVIGVFRLRGRDRRL
jgi:hypothetical protein